MLFRASDIIVAEHPEITDQVRLVDEYLHSLQGHEFRLEPAIDILDLEPGLLRRVIELYRVENAVEEVKVWLCPEDYEPIDLNEDGILECDLCENIYHPNECRVEITYRTIQAPEKVAPPGNHRFDGGKALLIGIGAYNSLNPLRKTRKDALDLYSLLIDTAQAGYPRDSVFLLLDEQATKPNISDKLDWLARTATEADTVIIFFSGHGAQRVGGFEPGEYLCPVEADWYKLGATAISTTELTNALRSIHAGRLVVLLDACHSGGVGEPKGATQNVQPGFSDDAYTYLSRGTGRVVIASCQPDEVSWELPSMQNGLFTHYVLEALGGGVSSEDGTVRILDLFTYISEHIPNHKPQHPLLKGEVSRNFAIALVPFPLDKST